MFLVVKGVSVCEGWVGLLLLPWSWDCQSKTVMILLHEGQGYGDIHVLTSITS